MGLGLGLGLGGVVRYEKSMLQRTTNDKTEENDCNVIALELSIRVTTIRV